MFASFRRAVWLMLLLGSVAQSQPPLVDRLGDPLPPAAVARLGSLRFRHGGTIRAMAFSPDGRMIVSGSEDRTACVWDATTGKLLHRLTGDSNTPIVGTFSPDSAILATGSSGEETRLWDVKTGKLLYRVTALLSAFSADGKTLATSDAGKLRLLDADTGKERRLLIPNAGRPVYSVALSPDGKLVAAADATSIVRVYHTATGKRFRTYEMPNTAVTLLAFSPDGKTLACGGESKVGVWETESEDVLASFALDAGIREVKYSADGKTVIALGFDGSVSRHEVMGGKEVESFARRIKKAESDELFALSPDGKRLAMAERGSIRVVDLATGQEKPALGPQAPYYRVAWSPAGSVVALHESGGALVLWTPTDGQTRRLVLPEGGSFAASFSPDGKLVASTGGENDIWLWDVVTGKVVRQVHVDVPHPRPLRFAPQGRSLIVYCGDPMLVIDWETGRERLRLSNTGGDNPGPVFTPDGRALIELDRGSRTMRVWELATGKKRNEMTLEEPALGHAVSPDGTMCAVAGGGAGQLRIYHLGRGKQLTTTPGIGAVYGIAWSPGGKLVATGGDDGTVRLWDPATGSELRRLEGHGAKLSGVAFSPDGKFLVSSSWDGMALVWDVAAALELPTAPMPKPEIRPTEKLWADLADADAAKAYAAIHALADRPAETITLLKGHLQPVVAPDPAVFARWVTDLDSENFETRDRAAKELQALDRLAEPALRKTLEGKPTPEVRRLVQGLLTRLEEPTTNPERLRTMRAVEVLEMIGTAEARRVLESLSKGAAGAPLTEEARAAAARLNRRAALP